MLQRDKGKGNRAHNFVTVKKKREKNDAIYISGTLKRKEKSAFYTSRRSNNWEKRHQIKHDVTWDRW